MPQVAMEMGAEAIIIGEMNEFIVIACLEMGLPVIETLHSISEAPGIRNQATLLKERFHPLPVMYVPRGAMFFRVKCEPMVRNLPQKPACGTLLKRSFQQR